MKEQPLSKKLTKEIEMKAIKIMFVMAIVVSFAMVVYASGKGSSADSTTKRYIQSTAGKGAAVNAITERNTRLFSGKGAAVDATMRKYYVDKSSDADDFEVPMHWVEPNEGKKSVINSLPNVGKGAAVDATMKRYAKIHGGKAAPANAVNGW